MLAELLLHIMVKENGKIFSGAAILGVGAFLAKLIGAAYRVPLTAIIGSEGLGLYQMLFPVYVVLLEFSGAGLPNALSKIISEEGADAYRARAYLKKALKFFSVVGTAASLTMIVFAKPFAIKQGDARAAAAYVALAPSVLFVCLISCFRGYFQGQMKMTPTASSQIIEQVIKLICGLGFSYLFMPDIKLAAAGAALGVTLSEAAAFTGLLFCYVKGIKKLPYLKYKLNYADVRIKTIIKNVIPVTLTGVILPVSQVIDSFIILNALKIHSENATAIFGLFTGVAQTIINLPVAVCYGIAVTAIPSVSGAKSQDVQTKNCLKCMLLTLGVSLPSAVLCYLFSPLAIKILFSGLSAEHKLLAVSLVKIMAINVVLASFLQTINAILIGKKKLYSPVLGLITGSVVKIILNAILVKDSQIGIYGGAVGLIACYFVANLVNFISAFSREREKERYESKTTRIRENDG